MNILLSAFACDPLFGSDEEVGWRWAENLARRGHRVSVITRASHQAVIEQHIAETGECASVNFIYHDLPWLHAVLRRVNRRNHLYYYFWQWTAASKVLSLSEQHRWDVIHHVTWVSIRQPSFMWRTPAQFIFGPVAGGDEIPAGYARSFSLKERMVEAVRSFANSLVRLDPLMRTTYGRAHRIVVTSRQQIALLPEAVRSRVEVALAIGTNAEHANPGAVMGAAEQLCAPPKLLFAGRLLSLKGMHIGLRAFAQILKREPEATLTIVGDGVDRARLEALAAELGIAHAVIWKGWMSKAELAAAYRSYDLLFYPSLRDSGAFVVLEALEAGVPVVCFDLGGPGVIVDESCGEAVAPPKAESDAPMALAEGALRQIERLRTGGVSSADCQHRAGQFTWSQLVETVYPSR